MPTSSNVGFVYAKCVRSGKGFFAGRYYALIKGAHNNGWSVVRCTASGDIYELIVHNVGHEGFVYDCEDFENSAAFKTDDYEECLLPATWLHFLERYETNEKKAKKT